MNKAIRFLTRTAGGGPDKADKFGVSDFLAYGYLLLEVLVILVPVF